jgi:ADP-heptose:LPS heptosyltransferase
MSNKYIVFHIDGGAGKSVLATAVCESLKIAYPERKIVIITGWPEVFLHNPNVYRVYKTGNFAYFYEDYIKDMDSIVMRLDPYHHNDFIHQKTHLIEVWCNLFGIKCHTLIPRLYLTQRELINCSASLNKKGPILLVQPFGGPEDPNNLYSWARDMPPAFMQKLINKLHPKFDKILHIKKEKQLSLENTTQVTDSMRNLFCYVYLADKIITIDSFVHHVAAAFNKSAAVGWISNSPTVFGHSIHKNILCSSDRSFRHLIDSYLEEADWSGKRHYECPYDDMDSIFKEEAFLEYCDIIS